MKAPKGILLISIIIVEGKTSKDRSHLDLNIDDIFMTNNRSKLKTQIYQKEKNTGNFDKLGKMAFRKCGF